eukprot:scaffold26915_cov71-Attheya_sp.AAC.8
MGLAGGGKRLADRSFTKNAWACVCARNLRSSSALGLLAFSQLFSLIVISPIRTEQSYVP